MSEIKFRDSVAMPLLALRGVTVFPSMMLHFDVGRDKSKKALEAAMNRDQTIFLLTQKDMRVDDPREADLYRIGTVSKVKQMLKLPGGGIDSLLLEMNGRIEKSGYLLALVFPRLSVIGNIVVM